MLMNVQRDATPVRIGLNALIPTGPTPVGVNRDMWAREITVQVSCYYYYSFCCCCYYYYSCCFGGGSSVVVVFLLYITIRLTNVLF